MKKNIATMVLASALGSTCALGLVGCDSAKPAATEPPVIETQEIQQTEAPEIEETVVEDVAPAETTVEETGTIVAPLPESIDLTNLIEGTIAVSLEKGGLYKDDNGNMMMDITVFSYDKFDMVDIASLKVGDTILMNQVGVVIESIETNGNGGVLINGGLDNGGYELRSDDSTIFYQIGYSDVKAYHEVGKITLPVAADFVYTDSSDLDAGSVEMTADEFFAAEDMDYSFNANNTEMMILDGSVKAMTRVYTP